MKSYDGPTMNIILEVPADAYHIEFTVKTVDENEEEHVYSGRMGLSEIRKAKVLRCAQDDKEEER